MPPRRTPYPVPAGRAGSWHAAGGLFRYLTHPPAIPIHHYTGRARGPIAGLGITQTVIGAGGGGTAKVGPSGLGTRWYPQSVTLSTKTGAADNSTATAYLGVLAASAIVGQSYAAGGDVIGLAVPMMQPGDLLYIVWSGGVVGDWASMQVIGDQEAMIIG